MCGLKQLKFSCSKHPFPRLSYNAQTSGLGFFGIGITLREETNKALSDLSNTRSSSILIVQIVQVNSVCIWIKWSIPQHLPLDAL